MLVVFDHVDITVSDLAASRAFYHEALGLPTVEGEWVEFARRGFGPNGLEDTAVESLVRAVFNEVAETSTDAG